MPIQTKVIAVREWDAFSAWERLAPRAHSRTLLLYQGSPLSFCDAARILFSRSKGLYDRKNSGVNAALLAFLDQCAVRSADLTDVVYHGLRPLFAAAPNLDSARRLHDLKILLELPLRLAAYAEEISYYVRVCSKDIYRELSGLPAPERREVLAAVREVLLRNGPPVLDDVLCWVRQYVALEPAARR